MELRPVSPADFDAVLALNAASVDLVSELDEAALGWFVDHGAEVTVVDDDGEVAAFTVVLDPGSDYWSANYAWFAERYGSFRYLDRIAVGERWRRRGLGTLLYDAAEAGAAASGRLLCEVDVDPPNEPSLAFHAARGYVEVGRLANRHGKLLVMVAKELAAPAPVATKEV